MAQQSRRKPKKYTGASSQRRDLNTATKWLNLIEFEDERGKPFRRFYKLETLTSAVDKMVQEGVRFIMPAIQKMIGRGSLSSLVFTLENEDPLRYIFLGKAVYGNKKRISFRLVVAKNQEEATRRVVTEFKHLAAVYKRIPDHMVEPVLSGAIYLPDQYRRQEHSREVGAYITSAPTGFEPLGIHRNEQYMSLGPAPHTFSKKETEILKQRMSTIILGSLDLASRDSIDSHQIDATTFQVHRPARGLPKLMLFNCVHMRPQLTPHRLLGFILMDTWTSRHTESPIVPDDPQLFFKALVEAVGKDTATAWVENFARLAAAGKVKAPDTGYVEELAEIAAG